MSRLDRGRFLIDREHLEAFGNDGHLMAIWLQLNRWALIKPKTFKHGLKQVTIKRGELLTSIDDIAEAMNFEWHTVKKRIEFLKACGSIVCSQVHRGMKISIVNYEKNQSLAPTRKATPSKSSSENQIAHHDDGTDDGTDDRTTSAPTYGLSNSEINKLREGEGDARARQDPPSSKNFNSNESENQEREVHTPPETSDTLPVEAKALAERWVTRATRMAPNDLHTLSKFITAIARLAETNPYDKLRQILDALEAGKIPPKLAKEFVTPMDATGRFFGGAPRIDVAWNAISPQGESKEEQQRKLDEQLRNAQRENAEKKRGISLVK